MLFYYNERKLSVSENLYFVIVTPFPKPAMIWLEPKRRLYLAGNFGHETEELFLTLVGKKGLVVVAVDTAVGAEGAEGLLEVELGVYSEQHNSIRHQ